MVIDDATVLRLRWRALLLHDRADRSVDEIVEWFGAVQAQDARQAPWALGVRSSSLTRSAVLAAHRQGRIVRTWVMRGTLHYVPAVDAGWMVEHLGRRMRPAVVSRLAKLGLDERDAGRGVDALVAALADGPQTRPTCRGAISAVLGDVTAEQAGRVIDLAALDAGVVPDVGDGRDQRFTLLDAVVPVSRRLDRAEALVIIARRFVRGHGPVTPQDLARWCGSTLTDARRAMGELGDRLTTLTWDGATVHLAKELAEAGPVVDEGLVRLLPAYDEHVIGYARRQPAVAIAHDARIVPGGNGIYQPTIATAARTWGTWKPTRDGSVEPEWFDDRDRCPLDQAMSDRRRFEADP